MRLLLQKTTPVGIIIALCVAVAFLITVFFMSRVGASDNDTARDGRLITIHDRGDEKVILTHARTIREALNEARVNLDSNDTVEPSLDKQLVSTDYTVNIYRARPVIVVDGAVREKVMTPYQTADQIAKDAGIELHDEDKTLIAPSDDEISDGAGLKMTIDRATPFTLLFYGAQSAAFTQAKTVGDMLKEKRISLGSNDTLSVDEDAPMVAGMKVEIWRNGEQTATQQEVVAFTTRQIKDADQPVGYRQVQTPGENGSKDVTYKIVMKNGVEASREKIQSVVTKQPKEQVEVIGTKMTNTFSGSFAQALARLRSCEGSYTSNTGNGYYGAYQFDRQTWGGFKGYAVASDAPPAVQDEKAWQTYQRRGWQPWPSCSKSQGLQDIYR